MAKKTNDIAGKAEPFLLRIEALAEDRQTEHAGYMARCRVIASDIRAVFVQAKAEGVAVKALRGLVKKRLLERKIAAIPSEFDLDDAAQYDALAAAFGDTPMGQHAKAQAEQRRKAESEDVRPRSLRRRDAERKAAEEQPEANGERPDEKNLERVGRGETVDTLVN